MMKIIKFLTLFSGLPLVIYMAFSILKNTPISPKTVNIVKPTLKFASPAKKENRHPSSILKPAQKSTVKMLNKVNKNNIQNMIDIYEDMSKFPKTSSPIKKKTKASLEEKYIVKKQLSSSLTNPELMVRSWPSKNYNYIPEDIPTVNIQVLLQNKLIKASIEAKLYNEKDIFIKNVSFKQGANNTYKSTFKDLKFGKYLIKFAIYPNNDKEHYVKSIESFTVSKQNILFEDDFKDYLDEQGNLTIEASIDVLEAGDYLLESVCYNKNSPIALAEKFYKLKKGKQTIKFNFHGYIFTSLKEQGYFFIKHLSLSRVNSETLGIIPGSPYNPEHRTSFYNSNQFNQSPFSNNEMIEKKRKLTAYIIKN